MGFGICVLREIVESHKVIRAIFWHCEANQRIAEIAIDSSFFWHCEANQRIAEIAIDSSLREFAVGKFVAKQKIIKKIYL